MANVPPAAALSHEVRGCRHEAISCFHAERSLRGLVDGGLPGLFALDLRVDRRICREGVDVWLEVELGFVVGVRLERAGVRSGCRMASRCVHA